MSSGQPESLLDKTLDPSFRLWDAYGVLPVLCDPSRRGQIDACVVKYDQVKDIIKSTKDRWVREGLGQLGGVGSGQVVVQGIGPGGGCRV